MQSINITTVGRCYLNSSPWYEDGITNISLKFFPLDASALSKNGTISNFRAETYLTNTQRATTAKYYTRTANSASMMSIDTNGEFIQGSYNGSSNMRPACVVKLT